LRHLPYSSWQSCCSPTAGISAFPAAINDAIVSGGIAKQAAIPSWVITVPVAAVLAAMIYFMIRGYMLP